MLQSYINTTNIHLTNQFSYITLRNYMTAISVQCIRAAQNYG